MMGRAWVGRVASLVFLLTILSCSKSSPTAPAPPPPPPPTGTAAAIFITPNSFDLPAGGGSLELVIATAGNVAGNVVAANVPVTLTTSAGQLSANDVQTDSTGHARVTWSGTSSATVSARAGDVLGNAAIRVPGSTPPHDPPPNPPPGPGPGVDPTNPAPAGLLVDIFPSPRGADASTPVTFVARVLTADGTAAGGLRYAWDFGDGTTSTEATPTHLFRPADHWTVTVRVTAADGRTGQSSVDIVVGASPAPVVSVTLAASPPSALIGATFTLTATAAGNSTSGPIVAYDWDFDTTTPSVDATTTTPTTTTSYTTAGSKTIGVTARTATTSATATTTVRVNDHPIVVDIAVSGPQTAGTPLTFTATVTSPAGGSGSVPASMTFNWDYGNGSETLTGASPLSVTHVYSVPDTYSVTVTVTTTDGRTATKTIQVKIV